MVLVYFENLDIDAKASPDKMYSTGVQDPHDGQCSPRQT